MVRNLLVLGTVLLALPGVTHGRARSMTGPRDRGEAPATSLAPCPSTPNCVSSLATDPRHRIDPLPLVGSPVRALDRARAVIEEMPGARVVFVGDGYLRAEYRSLLFRFVDDLELLVDEEERRIDVRSASRLGSWDWGVNRRRVEELRRRLEKVSPSAGG